MSTKRKLPTKLVQPMVRPSAKIPIKANVDDSKTVVSAAGNPLKANSNGLNDVVDISSDSGSARADEDDAESADESDSADDQDADVDDDAALPQDDVAMDDAELAAADAPIPDDTEELGEPSFGDLVQATASEPIDVAGAFEDPSSHALSYPQNSQIQPPSGPSLGTVLSQALKTNDVSLLESCLHTSDVKIIRATIQRLDSPLAAILLQKLAERLHRRPGRAGSLMVWVQWTLVTHGGYLATQRDLVKKLAALNRVIDERAKGLQSLLSLKGKLDMLESQIELRRSMQNQRRRFDEEDEDGEEDGVIYVEGQETDDEAQEETGNPLRPARNGGLEDISDDESVASEDMPMANGVIADSEDDGEDDSSEDGDGLIDDEAEETDADTGDEDEVDHDDQDSQGGGDEEESDDGARAPPPKKIQRTSGLFSTKR